MSEHPFAPYVRTLGRGKRARRSLTREEAADAMAMILRGEAEPAQVGAFLMLLRVKEETTEELAGGAFRGGPQRHGSCASLLSARTCWYVSPPVMAPGPGCV